MSNGVVIDGSSGEGGGQILRASFALAAVLQQAITVHSIRHNRPTKGLRPQHVQCLNIVEQLTSSLNNESGKADTDNCVSGNSIGSCEVSFIPLYSLNYETSVKTIIINTGSAGSLTLMIQLALPCLLYTKLLCNGEESKEQSSITLQMTGGADVSFSPPLDFMTGVLFPFLQRFCGINASVAGIKRGFYPVGRGQLKLSVLPTNEVKPFLLHDPGYPVKVEANIVVGIFEDTAISQITDELNIYLEIIKEMIYNVFPNIITPSLIVEVHHEIAFAASNKGNNNNKRHRGNSRNKNNNKNEKPQKNSNVPNTIPPKISEFPYLSVQFVLHTSTGCILSGNAGKLDSKEKMDKLSIANLAITKLLESYASGACVDEKMADELVIYMALASGPSSILVPSHEIFTSNHLSSCIEVSNAILLKKPPTSHTEKRKTLEMQLEPFELTITGTTAKSLINAEERLKKIKISPPAVPQGVTQEKGGKGDDWAGKESSEECSLVVKCQRLFTRSID